MPCHRVLTIAFGLVVAGGFAVAQEPDAYSVRLSWVPISTAEQNAVGGHGSAAARLSDRRLVMTGTFEGLPAPATAASLRRGIATGASGPAIAALEVTNGSDGRLTGDVELDRDALDALRAGHLYIQLHAERGVPPDDAVLRGWLLPAPASGSSAPARR